MNSNYHKITRVLSQIINHKNSFDVSSRIIMLSTVNDYYQENDNKIIELESEVNLLRNEIKNLKKNINTLNKNKNGSY